MESAGALAKNIPHSPGVYKYYNKTEQLIYVGKAKDLKKRVSSYFTKSNQHNRKTLKLVSEIKSVQFIVTPTELDALLLENNLIKQNQPKYNILLKDDKSFPYICVSNQRFPRIFSVRNIENYKGSFFGPYTSVVRMKTVLDLIHKIYTIRTCKYNLSKKNITSSKFKICLEYHIGNCKGPCEGKQTEEEYLEDLEQAINILKGNIVAPRKYLEEKMSYFSKKLEFEKAAAFKNKLDQLNNFYTKATVVNPKLGTVNVLAIISSETKAYISFLHIKSGSIIQSKSIQIKKKLNETDEDLFIAVLPQLISLKPENKYVFLSNVTVQNAPDPIIIEVPKIGDKNKLVKMAVKNALIHKKNEEQVQQTTNTTTKSVELLKTELNLKVLPLHIECFDNSNIQGTHPVASMVCFKNGKPSKKDYRKFNIKTVTGPDDFASMNEVVARRYKRLVDEKLPLPNLILIDGGKGQLGAAVEALKEVGIYGKVAVAGIAKKLEEIYVPGDQLPVHINKKSPALKLIQQLRDEAHRFAITFHRSKRSKTQTKSFLDDINGIGAKSKDLLLTTYKSPAKIKAASLHEISALIGKKRARILFDHIKKAQPKG